ncbi:MAG: hypothetical protein ACTH0Y_03040 [Luteimonas sp.]
MKPAAFALMALAAFSMGCHGNRTPAADVAVIDIGSVEPVATASARELAPRCDTWAPDQKSAAKFFAISQGIPARAYHHDFDTAPCKVAGTLRSNGGAWEFEINGAAKGLWRQGDTTLYFGCTDPSCAPLVLWEHLPMDAID